ncbi:hypothetical protein MAR_006725 [Mya arenaria]|uniref:Uncharacterized protein n=1 Tax=Mya arenaria TaxID=6604 RepID=A0ABY7DAB3_MYAAR|nr:hypothetical protein MAR_006725 [Mya arenaria]
MTSSEVTEQRAMKHFCVAIGKTPIIKPCLSTSVEDDSGRGRKKKITENLISNVSDAIENDRRQNVVEISQ